MDIKRIFSIKQRDYVGGDGFLIKGYSGRMIGGE